MTETMEHINRVGLSPAQYLVIMTNQADGDPATVSDDSEREKLEFTKLNLHRTGRISRTWRPTHALSGLLARLPAGQTWLVLTEPWCGDSAQCLPCLVTMAAQQSGIKVQLVLRDANLDLMDQYLTNGTRSIPRLVAFDQDGHELFQWGPRPAAAQEVFAAAKAEGLEKPDILERLHLFYGRNRGAALDAEFCDLLTGFLDGAK